jgi:hypothetical protein
MPSTFSKKKKKKPTDEKPALAPFKTQKSGHIHQLETGKSP